MKILREFRRFILIKSVQGRHADIRSHVFDHIAKLALGFHVSPQTIVDAVDGTSDDQTLALRLLETTLRAEDLLRQQREEDRTKAAQRSANLLAATTQWKGDRAHIDMPYLLSSLTRRHDLLLFIADQFTVSVSMALLLDLAKTARVRADLTGFVDAEGLHLRWETGGLDLRSQSDPKANMIVVCLPPMPAVAAA